MIYITRKEHSTATHKLSNQASDKAKNFEVFGKCANENWHGHNYELYVTVKGEVNKDTGFVVNLKNLGDLIKSDIIEILDHKNLNVDVDGLSNILPSTENVAIFIWDILKPKVKEMGAELHSVKLQETENNYVEYFGGK